MKLSNRQARELGIPLGGPLPVKRKPARPAPALRGKRVDLMWLILPMPPSANNYYTVSRGRKILSKEGRKYREKVLALLLEAPLCHVVGRLRVEVTAHKTTRRRFDLDNLWKPLLDALQEGGVYGDDSQIDHQEMTRGDLTDDDEYVTVKLTAEPTKQE